MMLRPLIRPLVRPLTRRVTEPGFGWSPRALFANGEQGAWYDPSDLSTLYRDSAGTRPVTALGQPVGLMLDKSKGLARGPELVTDGGFDSETVWWSVVKGTAVINSGALVCTDTGGGITLYKDGVTTAGKWYEINLDLVSASSNLVVYVESPPVTFSSTPGRKRAIALASTTRVAFQIGGGVGATFTIDNISVRELPGNHARQPTGTARPTLAAGGALDYDGVDDKLTTTFPDLGTNVTIARSIPGVGASVLTGQTIGAGARDDSTDHHGLLIINRALTAPETALVTRWANMRAGV